MTERPFPPQHLTKLDELWGERPFPPHHLTKLHELWAERPSLFHSPKDQSINPPVYQYKAIDLDW